MRGREPYASADDVLLRDVAEEDLLIFFGHLQDPADREAFTAHWARILNDETIVKKTVLFGGRVAGNVLSFGQLGEREVSYWIGRRYWGMGLATRALGQFLGHVEERPIYARAAKDNVASLRVLEKCGFEISGEDRGFSNARGQEVEEFILTLE